MPPKNKKNTVAKKVGKSARTAASQATGNLTNEAKKKKRKKHVRALPVNTKNTRNRTGVIGVYRGIANRPGQFKQFYRARWIDPSGRSVSYEFSVYKYGERGAFLRAVDKRIEFLTPLVGEKKARELCAIPEGALPPDIKPDRPKRERKKRKRATKSR